MTNPLMKILRKMMTKGYNFIIASLVFIINLLPSFGQDAIVYGSLTDMHGSPIPNAEIIFRSKDSIIVHTDSVGKFTLRLPQGNSYIIFAHIYGQRIKFPNTLTIQNYGTDIELEMDLQIVMDTLYKEILILPDIHFEFDKAIIKPESFSILDSIANWILANPSMVVEIAGHTDNIGSAEYNLKLSQRRAEAVRQYLINKGVPPERIYARGYGETQPIADNSTEEGRAKNRRVELRIIQK